MIFVTGDLHADLERFTDKRLRQLRKGDSLLICGDFGLIWDGSDKEKRLLKKLGKKKYNILFVEGAHENFDELEKYETEEWCGGLTRHISGNLRQLVRGYIFDISGKRIFAFGGGRGEENGGEPPCSEESRTRYEVPSPEELAASDERLAALGGRVDHIISYEAPQTVGEFIHGGKAEASTVSVYLEGKKDTLSYDHWFFGKHHVTKIIPKSFMCVFDAIIDAETLK